MSIEISLVAQHEKYVIKQSTPLEQLLEKEKSLSNLQEAPMRPLCVH